MSGNQKKNSPGNTSPESNTVPIISSEMVPDENVCLSESVFENITFPPTSTVTVLGM